MAVITVPALEDSGARWPSLGRQVVEAIEANLTFGPGDLFGKPAIVDKEKRALIHRIYEVHPPGAVNENGKGIAGRRRFRRCAISLQKGSAKTELAAWIAAMELWQYGPVRCDGFDAYGEPVGRAVEAPYIPMVAYTEEMAEDLAYGVLKAILEKSAIANDFDIGFERITRAGQPHAKALALAGAPDSRDGALTTFAHKDETHRWTQSRLIRAHRTMVANLTKRPIGEPWELETTTAYSPGEGSVAEDTAAYAADVLEGGKIDSKLFFFHRQASDGYDWKDPAQRREALIEAAGASAEWKDIDGISEQWQDPRADFAYLERVFGNRPIATAAQAFNATAWANNARPGIEIPRGASIAIGFDGSKNDDSTWAVAEDLESAFQWPLGHWDRPETGADGWEVPVAEVDAVIAQAFADFDVVLLYADPSKWSEALARWANRFGANRQGKQRIVQWPTTLYRKMSTALREYAGDIESAIVLNNGDLAFARHIGNAQKQIQTFRDDDGAPLWLIRKDRPGSPNKIDGAMAGCLAHKARNDALASGARPRGPAVSPSYSDTDSGYNPAMAGIRRKQF